MGRGVALILLLLALAPQPAGGSPGAATLAVVERGPGSLTLELAVPELEASPGGAAGCVRLGAPGLAQLAREGRPAVPVRGALVALPGLPAGPLRVEVLRAEGRPLAAARLCPAVRAPGGPLLSATGDEGAGPAAGGAFPGALAEAEVAGVLRGVPAARVLLFPLQVDEGGGLTFYPRLRVRLAWPAGAEAGRPARVSGGPFDAVLEAVLLPGAGAQAGEEGPLPAPGAGAGREAPTLPALKVFVERDGVVQVTAADAEAAGWPAGGVPAAALRLEAQGSGVPVWVEDRDADGAFDGEDLLLFYGQAADGPYTRRSVYWLSGAGPGGPRMAERDVAPVHGYAEAADWAERLHAEVDTAPGGYWQNPPGREAQDHWYWTGDLRGPASAELPFEMPAFEAGAGDFTLRVRLAGRTNDPGVQPDHHTRIWLNGTPVDEAWWDGMAEFLHTAAVPAGAFVPGTNRVTVETAGDTGAAVDSLRANWLEVDYRARYASRGDRLAFGAPGAGPAQFRVAGFSSAGAEAFDVSDPAAPVRLTGVESVPEGDGTFTAVLEDVAAEGARYLALLPGQRDAPAGVEADRPSALRDPANGADEIVIAYDAFYTATLPLAELRRAEGLRVAVVRASDVYDEFSGGRFSPQAIRDFLAHAYREWAAPAPSHVLLVGDAHLDFLDRFGTGKPVFVPSRIFDANGLGETGDDTWFGCVDGDDALPDLLVGRLSARSAAEVEAMAAKLAGYAALDAAQAWVQRALFVADDDWAVFELAAEAWIARLPAAAQPARVYAGDYPPGDPQADIEAEIERGASLVAYVGHGNQDRWGSWAGGRLFDLASVGRLDNGGRLPFVATATCLNGFFVNPLVDYCLAEELARKAEGGAIAVWSPTALGFPQEHDLLFGALFEALYGAPGATLGQATTQAKLAAYAQGVSEELIRTFTLFGDPATRAWVPWAGRAHLPLVGRGAGGP